MRVKAKCKEKPIRSEVCACVSYKDFYHQKCELKPKPGKGFSLVSTAELP